MKNILKKLIPKFIFRALQSPYHYSLSLLGAIIYRFPSKKIKIVGITGTKGKTTTTELVNAVLEEAGFKTALAGTLRFKIGEKEERNLYKMTMPGRFFIQKFLRKAVKSKCDWVVLEMTSEGAKQWRHKWIDLDALIFTNLSPEHIESHGSFEKYLQAKLSIGRALESSSKKNRVIVANKDDIYGKDFLSLSVPNRFPFSLSNAEPYSVDESGVSLVFEGEEIKSTLKGIFNVYNILSAGTFASAIGISPKIIKSAMEKISKVRGRVEFVSLKKENPKSVNQNFDVVVDYAHTTDSLEKLYQAFPNNKKICILGNTGGGRDKWKRPEMAGIADKYCDEIFLTNEDPYDEDPQAIIEEMKKGVKEKPLRVIVDRREAINKGLLRAKEISSGDSRVVVLITGKGTDPFIMGPNDSKEVWDDATVVREELEKIL